MWIAIIIGVLGFIFGVFALGNIVYPLLVAWPKAKRLEREGKLTQPIPVKLFITAPIIWTILIVLSIWLVSSISPSNLSIYMIVLGITFIIVVVQIPLKNKDLQDDFNTTWKNYIKDE